ncbi:ABC-three component system protein [Kitasatospora sp. NPDC086801]|uniref:ABC-three component system protein n=1 Tax=Kitasatospora sp. NPDC086801 TaxID=3364066 RepID=UPI00382A06A8
MTQKMPHSAAGQMVGYLYQCEWALVELARRWFKDPEAELRMEMLDDIDILHQDTPVELVQSKHHGHAGELGLTSADLWRSINSWCDALDHLPPGRIPMLRLVTTQTISPGSLLAKLKQDTRDVDGALAALEAVASDADGAKTTRDWRARFMALSSPTRAALVGAVILDDQAPRVSEVDSTLREVVGIWKHDQQSQEILKELKGWWWAVSLEMLDHATPGRRLSVTAEELRTQIDYVFGKYTQTALPIMDSLDDLTEQEVNRYADRVFVAQLKMVGLGNRSIRAHMGEFHHAWAHRSRWVYRHHVTPGELAQFDTDLRQEWKIIFAKHADRFEAGKAGDDAEVVGENILEETLAAAHGIKLRQVDKRWIARGTLHALADNAHEELNPLGWHPNFQELLGAPDNATGPGE